MKSHFKTGMDIIVKALLVIVCIVVIWLFLAVMAKVYAAL